MSITINQKHLSLIRNHNGYIQRLKDKGRKMTKYICPHCSTPVETLQPKKSEVSSKGYWDSAMQCPFCLHMSFVKVFPSGLTQVIELPT